MLIQIEKCTFILPLEINIYSFVGNYIISLYSFMNAFPTEQMNSLPWKEKTCIRFMPGGTSLKLRK